MNFQELLEIIGDDTVFDASLIRVGGADPQLISLQLSRWVASGRLAKLRRGVYAVAEPYRRRKPEPFATANLLVRPSYVSLETALSFHGLIPEAVFTVTSVTTARPALHRTLLGDFDYRHISKSMFWGYALTPIGSSTRAVVASPEKALLDLVYLRPRADDPAFLRQLRLSHLERLDLGKLLDMARKAGKPKLVRAARVIGELAQEHAKEFEEL